MNQNDKVPKINKILSVKINKGIFIGSLGEGTVIVQSEGPKGSCSVYSNFDEISNGSPWSEHSEKGSEISGNVSELSEDTSELSENLSELSENSSELSAEEIASCLKFESEEYNDLEEEFRKTESMMDEDVFTTLRQEPTQEYDKCLLRVMKIQPTIVPNPISCKLKQKRRRRGKPLTHRKRFSVHKIKKVIKEKERLFPRPIQIKYESADEDLQRVAKLHQISMDQFFAKRQMPQPLIVKQEEFNEEGGLNSNTGNEQRPLPMVEIKSESSDDENDIYNFTTEDNNNKKSSVKFQTISQKKAVHASTFVTNKANRNKRIFLTRNVPSNSRTRPPIDLVIKLGPKFKINVSKPQQPNKTQLENSLDNKQNTSITDIINSMIISARNISKHPKRVKRLKIDESNRLRSLRLKRTKTIGNKDVTKRKIRKTFKTKVSAKKKVSRNQELVLENSITGHTTKKAPFAAPPIIPINKTLTIKATSLRLSKDEIAATAENQKKQLRKLRKRTCTKDNKVESISELSSQSLSLNSENLSDLKLTNNEKEEFNNSKTNFLLSLGVKPNNPSEELETDTIEKEEQITSYSIVTTTAPNNLNTDITTNKLNILKGSKPLPLTSDTTIYESQIIKESHILDIENNTKRPQTTASKSQPISNKTNMVKELEENSKSCEGLINNSKEEQANILKAKTFDNFEKEPCIIIDHAKINTKSISHEGPIIIDKTQNTKAVTKMDEQGLSFPNFCSKVDDTTTVLEKIKENSSKKVLKVTRKPIIKNQNTNTKKMQLRFKMIKKGQEKLDKGKVKSKTTKLDSNVVTVEAIGQNVMKIAKEAGLKISSKTMSKEKNRKKSVAESNSLNLKDNKLDNDIILNQKAANRNLQNQNKNSSSSPVLWISSPSLRQLRIKKDHDEKPDQKSKTKSLKQLSIPDSRQKSENKRDQEITFLQSMAENKNSKVVEVNPVPQISSPTLKQLRTRKDHDAKSDQKLETNSLKQLSIVDSRQKSENNGDKRASLDQKINPVKSVAENKNIEISPISQIGSSNLKQLRARVDQNANLDQKSIDSSDDKGAKRAVDQEINPIKYVIEKKNSEVLKTITVDQISGFTSRQLRTRKDEEVVKTSPVRKISSPTLRQFRTRKDQDAKSDNKSKTKSLKHFSVVDSRLKSENKRAKRDSADQEMNLMKYVTENKNTVAETSVQNSKALKTKNAKENTEEISETQAIPDRIFEKKHPHPIICSTSMMDELSDSPLKEKRKSNLKKKVTPTKASLLEKITTNETITLNPVIEESSHQKSRQLRLKNDMEDKDTAPNRKAIHTDQTSTLNPRKLGIRDTFVEKNGKKEQISVKKIGLPRESKTSLKKVNFVNETNITERFSLLNLDSNEKIIEKTTKKGFKNNIKTQNVPCKEFINDSCGKSKDANSKTAPSDDHNTYLQKVQIISEEDKKQQTKISAKTGSIQIKRNKKSTTTDTLNILRKEARLSPKFNDIHSKKLKIRDNKKDAAAIEKYEKEKMEINSEENIQNTPCRELRKRNDIPCKGTVIKRSSSIIKSTAGTHIKTGATLVLKNNEQQLISSVQTDNIQIPENHKLKKATKAQNLLHRELRKRNSIKGKTTNKKTGDSGNIHSKQLKIHDAKKDAQIEEKGQEQQLEESVEVNIQAQDSRQRLINKLTDIMQGSAKNPTSLQNNKLKLNKRRTRQNIKQHNSKLDVSDMVEKTVQGSSKLDETKLSSQIQKTNDNQINKQNIKEKQHKSINNTEIQVYRENVGSRLPTQNLNLKLDDNAIIKNDGKIVCDLNSPKEENNNVPNDKETKVKSLKKTIKHNEKELKIVKSNDVNVDRNDKSSFKNDSLVKNKKESVKKKVGLREAKKLKLTFAKSTNNKKVTTDKSYQDEITSKKLKLMKSVNDNNPKKNIRNKGKRVTRIKKALKRLETRRTLVPNPLLADNLKLPIIKLVPIKMTGDQSQSSTVKFRQLRSITTAPKTSGDNEEPKPIVKEIKDDLSTEVLIDNSDAKPDTEFKSEPMDEKFDVKHIFQSKEKKGKAQNGNGVIDILRKSQQKKNRREVDKYFVDGMFRCIHCPYTAKFRNYLKDHLVVHKPKSETFIYRCLQCPAFESKYRSAYNVHMARHKLFSNPEKFMLKCHHRGCAYQTPDKQLMKKHVFSHLPVDAVAIVYECHICDFKTKHKISIEKHVLRHQRPEETNWLKCNSCQYQTKYKDSLHTHKKMVHGDKSKLKLFKCDFCSYTSYRKHHWQRHTERHETDADFCTNEKRVLGSFLPTDNEDIKPITIKSENGMERVNQNEKGAKDQRNITKLNNKKDALKLEKIKTKNMKRVKKPKEIKTLLCAICGFQSSSRSFLRKHVLTIHTDLATKPKKTVKQSKQL